ncbi:MAG: hypothetical protein WCU88_07780 [Elusimicrobiota bacterium]|jgi:hypothetical protein
MEEKKAECCTTEEKGCGCGCGCAAKMFIALVLLILGGVIGYLVGQHRCRTCMMQGMMMPPPPAAAPMTAHPGAGK